MKTINQISNDFYFQNPGKTLTDIANLIANNTIIQNFQFQHSGKTIQEMIDMLVANSQIKSDFNFLNEGEITRAIIAHIQAHGFLSTGQKIVTIYGDSISGQNTGVASRFEGYGYFVASQIINGQNFNFTHETNQGVGGDDASEALARIADVYATNADIVVILLGANDFGTSSGLFRDPADVEADIDAIIAGIRANMSATIILGTTTPCDDNSADQIAARETYNAAIKAKAAADLIIWDVWEAVSDGSGNWKTGYSHDGVHPNLVGALFAGDSLEDITYPRWGRKVFTLSDDNVLDNAALSGTGGTISASIFTGQLADGWLTSGSGGTSADATLSKDIDDKQLITFNTSVVSTFSRRIYKRYTAGNLVGKQAYFEVEIEVTDDNDGDGIWYNMSAEIRNSSELAVGYDRRDNSDEVPSTALKAITADKGRTLILRSPTVTFPSGTTYTDGRINIEFVNTSGQSCNGQVKVHNAQLVVV